MLATLSELDPLFLSILGGVLGLMVGSFISMLSWRLPRALLNGDEPASVLWTKDRSHCPHCNATLPWYRLIPLFSWLASKGRCHHCQQKISARYPLIELFSALSTAYILWQYGISEMALAALIFNWFLLTISVIDMEHQLILDVLSIPLLWLGLLINTQHLFVSAEEAIWGAALGYVILWLLFHTFRLLTGKEGMGYGDFKLLAALGAWFGLQALPAIILIASLSSIIIGVLAAALKLRSLNAPIAFGPFLALGGWIILFWGSTLRLY
jgi:leader peptidase (prepilin peptidase)/N-methyltransferase